VTGSLARRDALNAEQRAMLDAVVMRWMKGERADGAELALALDWEPERVKRVGRELIELGMLENPSPAGRTSSRGGAA